MQRIWNREQGIYEVSPDDSFITILLFRFSLAMHRLSRKVTKLIHRVTSGDHPGTQSSH